MRLFQSLSLLFSTAKIYPLAPLRGWINATEVKHLWFAQWVNRLVPNTCSSGYDLHLFGYRILHLPSLCKLNPLYDELLDLRFRAADFLYELSDCDESLVN